MTVVCVLISWGRMNSRGCGAWVIVGRDGRLRGRPYPTLAEALAAFESGADVES